MVPHSRCAFPNGVTAPPMDSNDSVMVFVLMAVRCTCYQLRSILSNNQLQFIQKRGRNQK